jgi:hypothetical protein
MKIRNKLNNVANIYIAQGRYAGAEPLYKRSLAISEKALGPDHPDVATADVGGPHFLFQAGASI